MHASNFLRALPVEFIGIQHTPLQPKEPFHSRDTDKTDVRKKVTHGISGRKQEVLEESGWRGGLQPQPATFSLFLCYVTFLLATQEAGRISEPYNCQFTS